MKKLLSIILILFTSKALLANGFGGGVVGTGKFQEKFERINLPYNQLSNVYNFNVTQDNSIQRNLIKLDLNNIEEITLKDGSVVKYFEILERIEKSKR